MFINIRPILTRLGLVIALLMTYQSLFSQSFLSGLGIEVGGGYNQIFAKSLIPVPPDLPSKTSREGFSPIPTVRVKYDLHFAVINLMPFVSYNRFGGRLSQSNGYKDEFWFDVLDAGVFASYSIGPIDLGPALKLNRHLKVSGRWFGGANLTSNEGQTWNEREVTSWFRRWSYDLGARGSFNIANWNIAAESWFGVSSFQTPDLDGTAQWRQNHFRVLVGYTL